MEPLFFELIEVLKQQQQVVTNMVTAAQAQNQALRQVDAQALSSAVNQLQKLTLQMAKLDPQREQLQVKLEQNLGLKPGATVSDMLAQAPVEIQIPLKQLQTELKQQFDKLQQLNQVNRVLTQRVQQVNAALVNIMHPSNNSQTYQPGGKVNKETTSNLQMLNKTV
ncbi:flagellar protein FlgN [Peptococcaceae bacterium 1198_IL3148]